MLRRLRSTSPLTVVREEQLPVRLLAFLFGFHDQAVQQLLHRQRAAQGTAHSAEWGTGEEDWGRGGGGIGRREGEGELRY